jgi:hypothetical protein
MLPPCLVSTEGTRACHHKHAHQQVNQKGSIYFLSIFVCGLTDSRIELGFYRNFIIPLVFVFFLTKSSSFFHAVLRTRDPGSGAFLSPGSGIRNRFFPGLVPGFHFLNSYLWEFSDNFWVKITIILCEVAWIFSFTCSKINNVQFCDVSGNQKS